MLLAKAEQVSGDGACAAGLRLERSWRRGCCFDARAGVLLAPGGRFVCEQRQKRSDSVIAELSACSVSDGSLAA